MAKKTLNAFDSLKAWLDGKKTYILGSLAILTLASGYFGLIDMTTVATFVTALGFGSLLTIRSAISKLQ